MSASETKLTRAVCRSPLLRDMRQCHRWLLKCLGGLTARGQCGQPGVVNADHVTLQDDGGIQPSCRISAAAFARSAESFEATCFCHRATVGFQSSKSCNS